MYNPPAIKSSELWPLLKTGFGQFFKGFFSLKSLYILTYNFVPFLGVILNYYDFYTLIFVYLFETVILAFFALYKIYYFKWKEVMIYAPVTIIIVGFVTFFVYFAVVSFVSGGQPFKLSSLLFHYPLKSPIMVIANLIYYVIQEGYLMFKSMKSGVMRKVKDFLSSNLIKTQKDYLFNIVLDQINLPLVRSSVVLLAFPLAVFAVFPTAILFIFLRVYIGYEYQILFIFLYPAMFSVCFLKGIFDALMRINEKKDSEKLKELELKMTM